jgi:hypothetical protein
MRQTCSSARQARHSSVREKGSVSAASEAPHFQQVSESVVEAIFGGSRGNRL